MYPYALLCFGLNNKKITMSSLMTLDTLCLIDIFGSPSFYTIVEIIGLNDLSLGFKSSIVSSNIFSVVPTIFGLLSFSIFIKLGSNCFIDDWKSGLSLHDCTLKRSYSAASLFSFKLPSNNMLPNTFDCVDYL